MRIRRSVLFITQQITKTFLRRTIFTILGAVLIAGGAIVGQNILSTPRTTYAATPPDSCFAFNASTGVITDYYDNEGNNGANPACPRSVDIPPTIGGVAVTSVGYFTFGNKHISSVTIPSSVTSIGIAAFYGNQLSSVTIPSSVTSIGQGAFSTNELTSIVLPEDLVTIGDSSFRENKITSLTIPSSVTHIGEGAFYVNDISTLTIPTAVATIGYYAFEDNQLTSLTLGCGMSSIAPETFAINQLREVTVPDCITSIDPTAFFGQNPWGGAVDISSDPAHDWYSSDPAVRKTVYDNIWYARLYTSNPLNPHHLVDGSANEHWFVTGDLNGDNDQDDSLGGHLINPSSVSVRYVDGSNTNLSANYASTGRLTDGTNLSDYLVKNVTVPPIVDPEHPTPQEQAALEASLGQYYRIGQNISLTAATITGYTLQNPGSPHILQLVGMNNSLNFIYTPTPTPVATPSPSEPARNSTTEPTSTRPTPRPAASVTVTSESAPTTTPVETRTSINFAAQSDSATNPTAESVPKGLAPIMAKSSLKVDETKACHQIDSAQLLPTASFTAPDASYKTLGGLAFVLNCAIVGGDAAVTFTLGDTISDITKIKIYKQNSHGDNTDITNQVNVSNSGNRTALRYSLQDGKSLDGDGIANSSISDPIYISVPNDAVAAGKPTVTNKTQWSTIPLIAGSIVTVLVVSIAIVMINKRRKL